MNFVEGTTYILKDGVEFTQEDVKFLKIFIHNPLSISSKFIRALHYYDGYSDNPCIKAVASLPGGKYIGTDFFTPKKVVYYGSQPKLEIE